MMTETCTVLYTHKIRLDLRKKMTTSNEQNGSGVVSSTISVTCNKLRMTTYEIKIYNKRSAVPLRTHSHSPSRSADLFQLHLLGHRLTGLLLLTSPTAGRATGHRGFRISVGQMDLQPRAGNRVAHFALGHRVCAARARGDGQQAGGSARGGAARRARPQIGANGKRCKRCW
jgi:hypothetical protein